MGIKDRLQQVGEAAQAANAARAEADRYDVEVNKGSMNAGATARHLNGRWADGWRLHTMLAQDGNTVLVFERR